MNVLVAGGAGMVGARLSDALIEAGHRVVVYDDMTAPHSVDGARWLDRRRNASGRVSFVFRDVRDVVELDRAIAGVDAVIHAAAPLQGSPDVSELSVRVSGTIALLSAIQRRAPDAHLVLLSESGVYGCPVLVRGGTAMFAAREGQALTPETPSASAAACAEQYALAATRASNRKATVLRLPLVYASDSVYAVSDAFPARLAMAARRAAAIAPNADPRWPLDLIHVEDVAGAVLAILHNPDHSVGEVFNAGVGAKNAPSVWDLMQHLASLGGRARLLPPLSGVRPSPVLDVTRIARLGWEPACSWKDGIARLFGVTPGIGPDAGNGTIDFGAQAVIAWPRAEGRA